ncbi:hypothetical protein FRC06_000921 [Ceratobasidium sp. 370]|nr:hypothetical protein FRC06_000921 [Ceratobasidium sp. 370]
MPELSDDDLDAMDRDLLTFNEVKAAFVNLDIMGLPLDERRFHLIPKIHMLTYYTYLIRELGTPDGFNTEITKRLHIDCVKEPWRATNHVDPIPQMISYLEKKEAWTLLRAYLHDTGRLIDKRFQELGDSDEEDDEGPEELLEGHRDGVEGGTWHLTPSISIAQCPVLGRWDGSYLISKHKATDLVDATVSYLHGIAPPGTSIPLFEESFFKVWKRCKLHHRRLPFYPSLSCQADSVCAFPSSVNKEGRLLWQGFFDVVLFSPTTNNPNPNNQGLHRWARAGNF